VPCVVTTCTVTIGLNWLVAGLASFESVVSLTDAFGIESIVSASSTFTGPISLKPVTRPPPPLKAANMLRDAA
jgi:hypothetical protein